MKKAKKSYKEQLKLYSFVWGENGWSWLNAIGWFQLHPFSPQSLATGDLDGNGQDELIVDFGPQFGLWVRQNNLAWVFLHPLSPPF